jgi:putative endonuclease
MSYGYELGAESQATAPALRATPELLAAVAAGQLVAHSSVPQSSLGGQPKIERTTIPTVGGVSFGMNWTVYIARCRDGSLYTGITTDPERRLAEHNSGSGGAYTRSKNPIVIVYREPAANRSEAQQRERAIKRLRRPQKEELIAGTRPTGR